MVWGLEEPSMAYSFLPTYHIARFAHEHVPIVLSGDWLREEPPMKDVEQHNVVTAFIDGSYQFFCKNVREAGFVIHKNIGA